jgi:plasmid stabilization system protein ParE
MTAAQGFELHPGATRDITEIWEFIAKDNLFAARDVREDILDTIRKLVPFPDKWHRRTDLTSRPLRFQTVRADTIIVKNYARHHTRMARPSSLFVHRIE